MWEQLFLYFPLLALCAGMMVLVFFGKVARQYRNAMIFIYMLSTVLTMVCAHETVLANRELYPMLPQARVVLSFLSYSLRPVVILGFISLTIRGGDVYVTQSDRKRRNIIAFISIPAVINALLYSSMFWAPRLTVYFSSDNVFHRGTLLAYFSHMNSILYMIAVLILAIVFFRGWRKRGMVVILICLAASICSMIFDTLSDGRYSSTCYIYVICATLYYTFLQIRAADDDTAQKELELQKQRNSIMLSQIQPHFLYNTLGTIEVLCHSDPELAADTVRTFSKYLRGNMESLSLDSMIPIERELQHTSEYTAIEELRFNKLQVHYEIEDVNFAVPPLTVQPLVENAIRHGVRGLNPGIVTIRTEYRKETNEHIVIIDDNGVGFDTCAPATGRGAHIGIQNVRERLNNMAGGTLEIDSEFGRGTTIFLTIPGERIK